MTQLNWPEILPFSQAMGWTLLHSIWQIALVGFALRLILWFVPHKFSNVRYTLLLAGLLVPLVWAAYTFSGQRSTARTQEMAHPDHVAQEYAMPAGSAPLARTDLTDPGSTPTEVAVPFSSWLQTQTDHLGSILRPYLHWVALIWYAGVLILSAFMGLGFYQMRQLRTRNVSAPNALWDQRFVELARKMGIRQPVEFLLSGSISEPLTFHFFRPVVLAPVSLFTGLSREQVETLLLHELAHIRRYDFLVNIFQSVIEVLFFYHPTVWWISGKLREVREHCCDDLVLKVQDQPMLYAEALTHLQLFHHPRKTKLVMYVNGKKGNFSKRILRLFGQYDQQRSGSLKGSLVGVLLLLCLVLQGFFAPAEQPAPRGTSQVEIMESEALPPAVVQALIDTEAERLDQASIALASSNSSATALIQGDPNRLLEAIHHNQPEEVKQLIKTGVDLNAVLSDGRTALTEAAHHDHTDIARLLLRNGAEVNLAGKAGYTALMEAAEHGHQELFALLLGQRGVSINHASKNGHTALLEAAENGHYEIVKTLIQKGADLSATTHDGWNAWKEASAKGHERVAALIREACEAKGISWEPAPTDHSGPEHKPSNQNSNSNSNQNQNQDFSLVGQSALPQGKLPPYIKTSMLKLPIKDKVYLKIGPFPRATKIKLSLDAVNNQSNLVYEVNLTRAELHEIRWNIGKVPPGVYWLTTELDGYQLKERVEIGVVNKIRDSEQDKTYGAKTSQLQGGSDECQELLYAVKDQNVARVRELLKTVDPNCTFYYEDEDPRSPLVAAARLGNLEIAKLLIAARADVEYHGWGDETALMAAAAYGHLELVRYLVGQNADINKTLTGDGTALLVASRNGHLPIVQYLLDEGAEVNASVTGDGTALICAARSGRYEVAKLLLEKGADPFQVSPGDEYAMYHARMNGDKKMIQLLREYEDR
ncbi:ankyrin repeat domain-containing protein [Flavilitoribacter nigricans]|nr:ankyrin repeat domain-containing protein [Flavilitoribacter nigricans]